MDAKRIMEGLYRAVLEGDGEQAVSFIKEGLKFDLPANDLMDTCVDAVREVGRLWEEGEYFLPELVSGGDAATSALDELRPALALLSNVASQRLAVVGTVKGDIHDIGKTLVAHMLRARGWEVIDLGVDVSADVFVETVRDRKPDLLGLSSLLTTTMLYQQEVIEQLKQQGLRDGLKILVGGAPVTATWANEIGADGTAEDAMHAADLACDLLDGANK